MTRSLPSLVSAFLGDLAALAGLALFVADASAVAAGGASAALASDACLVAAGVLVRVTARSAWREGPTAVLALLVAGAAPGVVLSHRWWAVVAAAAAVAGLAPHVVDSRRARLWVVLAALLGLAAFELGPIPGIAAAAWLVAAGLLSLRLARGFEAAAREVAEEHERTIGQQRRRLSELDARVAQFEGREPTPRRSLVQLAFVRRLGVIGAISSAMARELRLAGAAGEGRLSEAASRCAEHADHLARLAAGGAAREEETTLAFLWPRIRDQLSNRALPGHHVEWKIPADLAPVAGSASEWVQILSGLAENSIEAMADAGVLTFEAAASELPGRARIVVEDNGCGISPDLLPHVLEPFRTSRADQGAQGLGLALVASMIEALEGTITLASAPGRGTRVEIVAPFYAAASPAKGQPVRFEGTVLFADDSREMRLALRRLLESLGLEVVEADSGTVALAQFAANPARFRAMLLDVVMPGTPVEDVVVRAREIRPDVPVLLISGFSVDRLLENVVALGGVRFLHKPLVRDELVATLRDLFTVGGK